MSSRPMCFAVSMLVALVLGSCRAANPQDMDSDLDQAVDKPWYSATGQGGACDAPASACSGFKDDKAFIDLCVSKGHQARTCGCELRCSGKIDCQAPPEESALARVDVPGSRCTTAMAQEAAGLLAARVPGGSLDRCLSAHLCGGMTGSCEGDALRASTRLRALSLAGCEEQIVGTVCRDGFVDSLQCPEAHIASLSRTWSEFRSRDVAVKRCMQKLLCSGDAAGCGEHLSQARALKAAVDQDGCEYWLRSFCSLGGVVW